MGVSPLLHKRFSNGNNCSGSDGREQPHLLPEIGLDSVDALILQEERRLVRYPSRAKSYAKNHGLS
jgi:hypothetical protein